MAVLYRAQPKQYLFHASEADETLYGGSAGGGKSFAIIWDALAFGLSYERVRISIFRRTYPELEKSVVEDWLKYIPTHLYEYNKKDHKATLKNGSFIEFNHCELETDVHRFQSAQYDRLYFDELTTFSESIYVYLHSRCRTTNPAIRPQVKSATNPTGVGHLWVKARFIDGAKDNEVMRRFDPETKSSYTTLFIPARVFDNEYIMSADPAYVERLMKLPEEQRRALLDGNWDVFQGQFFKEWDRSVHVVEPFAIPDYWTRICGLDWGYSSPSVILWVAFSPKEDPKHKGRAYVYRELVKRKATDRELAEEYKTLSKGEKISYVAADPKLWSVTQYERGESIAHRLINQKVPIIKADNARVAGWNVLRSYLEHSDKVSPRLGVFSTCYYLIQTIPVMVHDDNRPEDLKSKGTADHAVDSLRYALMTRPVSSRLPEHKRPYQSFNYWFERIKNLNRKDAYVGSI